MPRSGCSTSSANSSTATGHDRASMRVLPAVQRGAAGRPARARPRARARASPPPRAAPRTSPSANQLRTPLRTCADGSAPATSASTPRPPARPGRAPAGCAAAAAAPARTARSPSTQNSSCLVNTAYDDPPAVYGLDRGRREHHDQPEQREQPEHAEEQVQRGQRRRSHWCSAARAWPTAMRAAVPDRGRPPALAAGPRGRRRRTVVGRPSRAVTGRLRRQLAHGGGERVAARGVVGEHVHATRPRGRAARCRPARPARRRGRTAPSSSRHGVIVAWIDLDARGHPARVAPARRRTRARSTPSSTAPRSRRARAGDELVDVGALELAAGDPHHRRRTAESERGGGVRVGGLASRRRSGPRRPRPTHGAAVRAGREAAQPVARPPPAARRARGPARRRRARSATLCGPGGRDVGDPAQRPPSPNARSTSTSVDARRAGRAAARRA